MRMIAPLLLARLRTRAVWLASIVLFAACDDNIIYENSADALVEGFVLRGDAPLPDALLEPVGNRYACDSPFEGEGLADGLARSDSDGWFRLHISSFIASAGVWCFDVAVTATSAAVTDTVRAVQATFFDGAIADTSHVLLRVDP